MPVVRNEKGEDVEFKNGSGSELIKVDQNNIYDITKDYIRFVCIPENYFNLDQADVYRIYYYYKTKSIKVLSRHINVPGQSAPIFFMNYPDELYDELEEFNVIIYGLSSIVEYVVSNNITKKNDMDLSDYLSSDSEDDD